MAEFCFYQSRTSAAQFPASLSARDVRIIIDAIDKAWTQIRTYPYAKSNRFKKAHWHDEDELTTKIMEILNDALDRAAFGPKFSKKFFQWVVRDAKQTSGNLRSKDQMPDLTFRKIRTQPGEDEESALFVEAKLIKKPLGCRPYVVDGLHRFVSGKYAPRVSFGMMLGYAHRPYVNAEEQLQAYFAKATAPRVKRWRAQLSAKGAPHKRALVSDHTRAKSYVSPFKTVHLWLRVP